VKKDDKVKILIEMPKFGTKEVFGTIHRIENKYVWVVPDGCEWRLKLRPNQVEIIEE
jgi:hypothetical protein